MTVVANRYGITPPLQKWGPPAVAVSAALVFVGLAIAGGILSYSSVPFGDMWGGAYGFLLGLEDGNTGAWWAQHNEHRIVLSRALFWLNDWLFGGRTSFLIVVNYLIILAAVALVYRLALERLRETQREAAPHWPGLPARLILGSCTAVWLFQWMQWENITWAFQSQFFLAQLLPLCGFYWLYLSRRYQRPDKNFLIALLFGVASIGTMANGVIALPLMTLYAAVTRQATVKMLILGVMAVASLALYFHNYQSPSYHGSLSQELTGDPVGLAAYVLLYLGSPVYYLLEGQPLARGAAIAASGLMGVWTLGLLAKSLRSGEEALTLLLVFYIAYLAGTALGTAGGRLFLGLGQALSPRYTTPALMAWAAFFILLIPWFALWVRRSVALASGVGVLVLALLLSAQLEALEVRHEALFRRSIAGLALELGVRDPDSIGHAALYTEALMEGSARLVAENRAVFGEYPFRDLREQLGLAGQVRSLPDCLGNLDSVSELENDEEFVRVSGWLYDPTRKAVPELLRFLAPDGTVLGFGLTGRPRQDVAKAFDESLLYAGFQGYLINQALPSSLHINTDSLSCSMEARVPGN